jgi:hypothetical protein
VFARDWGGGTGSSGTAANEISIANAAQAAWIAELEQAVNFATSFFAELGKLAGVTIGQRVIEDQEVEGFDLSQHGEVGILLGTGRTAKTNTEQRNEREDNYDKG